MHEVAHMIYMLFSSFVTWFCRKNGKLGCNAVFSFSAFHSTCVHNFLHIWVLYILIKVLMLAWYHSYPLIHFFFFTSIVFCFKTFICLCWVLRCSQDAYMEVRGQFRGIYLCGRTSTKYNCVLHRKSNVSNPSHQGLFYVYRYFHVRMSDHSVVYLLPLRAIEDIRSYGTRFIHGY